MRKAMGCAGLVLALIALVDCGGAAMPALAEYRAESPASAASPAPMEPGGGAAYGAEATAEAPAFHRGAGADEELDLARDSRARAVSEKEARPVVAQNSSPPAPPKPQGSRGPASDPNKNASDANSGSEIAVARAPMLIYTAQITMAVYEVTKGLAAVETLSHDVGGYLARRDDQSITIRVPATRFEEAIGKLEKVGDVLHKNVIAEDVTEEFKDLEVQLKNARAIRDRLEQLLQKAVKVEESLQIERELGRVAGEIERLEGRMKFLRDRAAFSTITVTFQARRAEDTHPTFHLPVDWLGQLGLGRLLSL